MDHTHSSTIGTKIIRERASTEMDQARLLACNVGPSRISKAAFHRVLSMLFSVTASVGIMSFIMPQARAQLVAELPVPTAAAAPHGIVRGSDGAIWFAESAGNKIGRIDQRTGSITEFPLPTSNSGPETMTVQREDEGDDSADDTSDDSSEGAIWFTEQTASRIGRITTDGDVTEFPTLTPKSEPHGLTFGPDGAIWFSERASVGPNGNGQIGRLDIQTGVVAEFPMPPLTGPEPDLLVAGPDGAVWFGERNGGKLGRIDPTTHNIVEFEPPTRVTATDKTKIYIHGITVGPDHAIWFTEQRADIIGRFDIRTQTFTEFPLPTHGNAPHFMVLGPDRNLWFTEQGVPPNLYGAPVLGNKIGRITPDGDITEFALPSPPRQPFGMTVGRHRTLWFAETVGNQIGILAVPRPGHDN